MQGIYWTVIKMSLGEKVRMVCTSKYAYGIRGRPGVVPPNSIVAFEIELLDFRDKTK